MEGKNRVGYEPEEAGVAISVAGQKQGSVAGLGDADGLTYALPSSHGG